MEEETERKLWKAKYLPKSTQLGRSRVEIQILVWLQGIRSFQDSACFSSGLIDRLVEVTVLWFIHFKLNFGEGNPLSPSQLGENECSLLLSSLSDGAGHFQAWVGRLGDRSWERREDAVSQTELAWTVLKAPQGWLPAYGDSVSSRGAWLSLAPSHRLYYVDSSLLSIWSPCIDYINNLDASAVDMESEIQFLHGRFQSSRHKGQASHRIAKDLQWRQLTRAWTWLGIH